MMINIIHDPLRKDRRVLVQSEIAGNGLDVRFWPAKVDPVMSFRGISDAHKQVVRWAREERLPMVCIAEDDFHLTHKGAWQYFLDHVPADFDMYLAGIYCGTIKPDSTVDDFCALHLYIVHERFYDNFLGVRSELHLDRGLANRGKFVVSNPFCAIQHAGWSDNKRQFKDYDYLLTPYFVKGIKLCCPNG